MGRMAWIGCDCRNLKPRLLQLLVHNQEQSLPETFLGMEISGIYMQMHPNLFAALRKWPAFYGKVLPAPPHDVAVIHC